MNFSPVVKLRAYAAVLCGFLFMNVAWAQQPNAASGETTSPQAVGLTSCEELPTGRVSDEELDRLVPQESPGRVFIRWRTETQEDNYGFNIYRAKSADGSYEKVNSSIIPGEGSTNIPTDYCFVDHPLPRGEDFYYYIESISTEGVSEVVEGTKGTLVKVKSVAEEREWLRKIAAARGKSEPEALKKTDEKLTTPTLPVEPHVSEQHVETTTGPLN